MLSNGCERSIRSNDQATGRCDAAGAFAAIRADVQRGRLDLLLAGTDLTLDGGDFVLQPFLVRP